jgi:hypothetical protein
MKWKYVLYIAFIVLLVIVNIIYNNHETNSRFKFDNTNVKQVWFFQGNHGLDYNVTIDKDTIQAIRNELLVGERKKFREYPITEKSSEATISLLIILDKGQVNIIQGDDDRIYVVSSKLRGTNKMFEYKSKYISDLLKDLYNQYSDK